MLSSILLCIVAISLLPGWVAAETFGFDITPAVCTDRHLFINSSGYYEVNCSTSTPVNITISPSIGHDNMNVSLIMYSAYDRVHVVELPSSNVSSPVTFSFMNITIAVMFSCKAGAVGDASTSTLPDCGQILVDSTHVESLVVSLHGSLFLSSTPENASSDVSSTKTSILGVSTESSIQQTLGVYVYNRVVAHGRNPIPFIVVDGIAKQIYIAVFASSDDSSGAFEWSRQPDGIDQSTSNNSVAALIYLSNVVGQLDIVLSNTSIFLNGDCGSSAALMSIVGNHSRSILHVEHSDLTVTSCASIFLWTEVNVTGTLNAVVVNSSLTGTSTASIFQIISGFTSAAISMNISLSILGGNVALAQHADIIQLASSTLTAMTTVTGTTITLQGVSVLLDSATLVTLRSDGCGLPFCSMTLAGAEIVLNATEFTLSTRCNNIGIPSRFTSWLIAADGAFSAVGNGNRIALHSTLFIAVDAQSDEALVFPLYAWKQATLEPPQAWDGSSIVYSDCSSRVYLVSKDSSLGSIDVSTGGALRGVPVASIDAASTCVANGAFIACQVGVIPMFLLSGVHVVYCPNDLVSPRGLLGNDTHFAQVQIIGVETNGFYALLSSNTDAESLAANTTLSLIVDAPFTSNSEIQIVINVTLREIAVVIPSIVFSVHSTSMIDVTAPPRDLLTLRMTGGIKQTLPFADTLPKAPLVKIYGVFSKVVNVLVSGHISLESFAPNQCFSFIPVPTTTPSSILNIVVLSTFVLVNTRSVSSCSDAPTFSSVVFLVRSPFFSRPALTVNMNLTDITVALQVDCSAVVAFSGVDVQKSLITMHNVSIGSPRVANDLTRVIFLVDQASFEMRSMFQASEVTCQNTSFVVVQGDSASVQSSTFLLDQVHVMRSNSFMTFSGASASVYSLSAVEVTLINVTLAALSASGAGWLFGFPTSGSAQFLGNTSVVLAGDDTLITASSSLTNNADWMDATIVIDSCNTSTQQRLRSFIGHNSGVLASTTACLISCASPDIQLVYAGNYVFDCHNATFGYNYTILVNLTLESPVASMGWFQLDLRSAFVRLKVVDSGVAEMTIVLHAAPVNALVSPWFNLSSSPWIDIHLTSLSVDIAAFTLKFASAEKFYFVSLNALTNTSLINIVVNSVAALVVEAQANSVIEVSSSPSFMRISTTDNGNVDFVLQENGNVTLDDPLGVGGSFLRLPDSGNGNVSVRVDAGATVSVLASSTLSAQPLYFVHMEAISFHQLDGLSVSLHKANISITGHRAGLLFLDKYVSVVSEFSLAVVGCRIVVTAGDVTSGLLLMSTNLGLQPLAATYRCLVAIVNATVFAYSITPATTTNMQLIELGALLHLEVSLAGSVIVVASTAPLLVMNFNAAMVVTQLTIQVAPASTMSLSNTLMFRATWANDHDQLVVFIGNDTRTVLENNATFLSVDKGMCVNDGSYLLLQISFFDTFLIMRSLSSFISIGCSNFSIKSPPGSTPIVTIAGGITKLENSSVVSNWIGIVKHSRLDGILVLQDAVVNVSKSSSASSGLAFTSLQVAACSVNVDDSSLLEVVMEATNHSSSMFAVTVFVSESSVALSYATLLRQTYFSGALLPLPQGLYEQIIEVALMNCSVELTNESGIIAGASPGVTNLHLRVAQSTISLVGLGTALLIVRTPALAAKSILDSSFLFDVFTNVTVTSSTSWFIALSPSATVFDTINVAPSTNISFEDFTVIVPTLDNRPKLVFPNMNSAFWKAPVILRNCDNWWRDSNDRNLRFTSSTAFPELQESLFIDECSPCDLGVLWIVASGSYILNCSADSFGQYPPVEITVTPNSLDAVIWLQMASPFSSLHVNGTAKNLTILVGGSATLQYYPVDANSTRSLIIIDPITIAALQLTLDRVQFVLEGSARFPLILMQGPSQNAFTLLVTDSTVLNVVETNGLSDAAPLLLRMSLRAAVNNPSTFSITFFGSITFDSTLLSINRFLLHCESDQSLPLVNVTWGPLSVLELAPRFSVIALAAPNGFANISLDVRGSSVVHLDSENSLVFILEALFSAIRISIMDGASAGEIILLSQSRLAHCNDAVLTSVQIDLTCSLRLESSILVAAGSITTATVNVRSSQIELSKISSLLSATNVKNVQGKFGITVADTTLTLSDNSSFLSLGDVGSGDVTLLSTSLQFTGGSFLVHCGNQNKLLNFSIRDGTFDLREESALLFGARLEPVELRLTDSQITLRSDAWLLSYSSGKFANGIVISLSSVNVVLMGGHCGFVLGVQGTGMDRPTITFADTTIVFQSLPEAPQVLPVLFYDVRLTLALVDFRSAQFVVELAANGTNHVVVCQPGSVPLQADTAFSLVVNEKSLWSSGNVWRINGCGSEFSITGNGAPFCPSLFSPLSNANIGIPRSDMLRDAHCRLLATPLDSQTDPASLSRTKSQSFSPTIETASVMGSGTVLPQSTLSVLLTPSGSSGISTSRSRPIHPLPTSAPSVVIGTSGQSVAVVAGALSPATRSISMQRSITVLRLANCDISVDDPVDIATSPTQMVLGDDALRYQRGAALGNLILFASLAVFCFLATASRQQFLKRWRQQKVSLWRAAASLRFPGWAVIFWTFLCQPLLSSALCVLFTTSTVSHESHSDRALGSVIVLVLLCAFVGEGAILVFRFHATRTLMHDEEGISFSMMVVRRLPCIGKRLKNRWNYSTTRPMMSIWVDSDRDHRHFVKHFGPIFEPYRVGRQWFHCIELLCAVVAAFADSASTAWPESACEPMLYLVCVTQILFGIVMVILRPYQTLQDTVMSYIMAALGGLTAILAVVKSDAALDAASVIVTVQVYFSLLELTLTIVDVAHSGRAQRFARKVLMLSSNSEKRNHLQDKNGVSTRSNSEDSFDTIVDVAHSGRAQRFARKVLMLSSNSEKRNHLQDKNGVSTRSNSEDSFDNGDTKERDTSLELALAAGGALLQVPSSVVPVSSHPPVENPAVKPSERQRQLRHLRLATNKEKVKELAQMLQDAYANNLSGLIERICANRRRNRKYQN
ncbi:membrane-associated protein, putative [Bodo saltans]|uniref:Membrane-associated protein, putative n=1 Tax=Bodo saltans TaxID=75058 RepID=A0A0S4JJM9_BODSA|nr:membrane-associated protein, putative [Bodo saltans]|eukprot:CUG88680.1 membrane-associated protein, putative [Bodo saltans]